MIDIEWKGKLIEVKTASIRKNQWKFLLYKQRGYCDYFIFFCKNENKETEHIFMIPDCDIKVNNLSISKNMAHKYEKYKMKVRN